MQFIFGIISLIVVSSAIVLKKVDVVRGVLFFSLLLSTFNGIKFCDFFDIRIGIFHLIPLLLLVVLIFLRVRELISLKEECFGDDLEDLKKAEKNRIAIYLREFQNLSSEELIKREKNNKLVEEAVMAIRQLLKERNIESNKT